MQKQIEIAKIQASARKSWIKKKQKILKKDDKTSSRSDKYLYVLEFTGGVEANEVNSLREEISAIISVAQPKDEVLLKLESPGGAVNAYGLAAAQLERLKKRNIILTVAVDKVAASGGYLMACVADHIIAAPFAIIGSIGVVAQIPNFHKLLKQCNIDIELHTAGQNKRTLTMLGENNDQSRKKFKSNLNVIHLAFQNFVSKMRPGLKIAEVSTGDYWLGQEALKQNLVDSISTSDTEIISRMQNFQVLLVKYKHTEKLLKFKTQFLNLIKKLF